MQLGAIMLGAFFLLLGAPITINALPDPIPEVVLYFARPTVWPLDHLDAGWVGVVCLVLGVLLSVDAWMPLPRRWQRTLVWGLGWLVMTDIWVFVCLALGNGQRSPFFSWAAVTSLWVGYTIVWVGGLPLRGASEDA